MSILAAPSTRRPLKPEFERLFREHSQMVYRTAYTIVGSAADAEDVLQTVFLGLLRNEPDLQSNPKGYLYRAAINSSLNVVRSRKRIELTEDTERFVVPVDRKAAELHARLTEAIAELAPADAHVLVLRYIYDYSDAEIAKLIGVSRGTMAMRLFRARLRLRKLMRDAGEEE
jgi:RNA polymerase sigma-70 factor (ECF subfamily)